MLLAWLSAVRGRDSQGDVQCCVLVKQGPAEQSQRCPEPATIDGRRLALPRHLGLRDREGAQSGCPRQSGQNKKTPPTEVRALIRGISLTAVVVTCARR